MRLINKGCSERLSGDETDLQPLSAGFNMGCTQFTGEDGRRGGGGGGSLSGAKSLFLQEIGKNKTRSADKEREMRACECSDK